ncbi:MAG: phosphoenolpyruvate carboxylase, partial [Promethearchaeota archaeon]
MNEEKCLEVIERYSEEYSKQVFQLAPLINSVSEFIPKRRKRKLHIGLFGYCRKMGDFCLPRAIKFTASLSSLGLPPSILGLNALDNKDYDFVKTQYIYFEEDLKDSLKFFNPDQNILKVDFNAKLKDFNIDYETD